MSKQTDYPLLTLPAHDVRTIGRQLMRRRAKSPSEYLHVRRQFETMFPKSDFFARGQ